MFAIGRRTGKDDPDPAEMLRACHERIRAFLATADRLASDAPAAADDVQAAAAAVARYFREALPLHERDEDESIAPRLAGRDAALDRALADMRAAHAELRPWIDALLAACDRVAAAPGERASLRAELARVLAELDPRFDAHLAAEEAMILPAVAALAADLRAAIIAEMRARREP